VFARVPFEAFRKRDGATHARGPTSRSASPRKLLRAVVARLLGRKS
jgi:hypothetical protein